MTLVPFEGRRMREEWDQKRGQESMKNFQRYLWTPPYVSQMNKRIKIGILKYSLM